MRRRLPETTSLGMFYLLETQKKYLRIELKIEQHKNNWYIWVGEHFAQCQFRLSILIPIKFSQRN